MLYICCLSREPCRQSEAIPRQLLMEKNAQVGPWVILARGDMDLKRLKCSARNYPRGTYVC